MKLNPSLRAHQQIVRKVDFRLLAFTLGDDSRKTKKTYGRKNKALLSENIKKTCKS